MNWTRFGVIGTAESWRQAPWNDPTITLASLNDAYMLNIPRADIWYELHPVDKFWYRDPKQKVIEQSAIPPGTYVRPKGHLEWLKTQAAQIPVFLQKEPPADWGPNAQRFPIEEVLQYLHGYSASAPSLMIAHAILNGCTELHVYGIHLATEQEYRDQRPQFEALLGRFLGSGRVEMTVENKLRTYRSGDRTLVLPVSSPILSHPRVYAYDPKPMPDPKREALKARMRPLQEEQQQLVKQLVHRKWYQGRDKALARLRVVDATLLDLTEQIHHQSAVSSSLGAIIQVTPEAA